MSQPWVLVTGASGFIGSRLIGALLERGERVKAFVHPGGDLRVLQGLACPELQLAFGDVAVEHTVYRALAGCDRAYHIAMAHPFRSRSAADIFEPIVQGTRSVLEAARRRGLRRVVATSSALALGTQERPQPMDERHPFELDDPETYVAARRAAYEETLAAAATGQPLVALLPSLVIGPGDSRPTLGGHALLSMIVLGSRIPVIPGGINLVDVDDVVQGHLLAMERGRLGESYILGGDDITYDQLLSAVADVTGVPHSHVQVSRRLGVLAAAAQEWMARLQHGAPIVTRRMARHLSGRYFWVSSAKAQLELGYRHRPVRESLSRAIHYFHESGQIPHPLSGRLRLLPTG